MLRKTYWRCSCLQFEKNDKKNDHFNFIFSEGNRVYMCIYVCMYIDTQNAETQQKKVQKKTSLLKYS